MKIAVHLDERGLDLNLYRLRKIITTDRELEFVCFSFEIGKKSAGLPMIDFLHKYQSNQMRKMHVYYNLQLQDDLEF